MGVRPRLDGDLEQCVSLLADIHRVDGYPAYWPEDPAVWLSPTGMLGSWVAEETGRVAGHVALASVPPGPAAEVWSRAAGVPRAQLGSVSRLFVAHAARGAGAGRALLDAACAEAARRCLNPVLDVVETNTEAIRLYERRGWRRVHSEPWADARDERLTLHYYVRPRCVGLTTSARARRLRRGRGSGR